MGLQKLSLFILFHPIKMSRYFLFKRWNLNYCVSCYSRAYFLALETVEGE